MFDLDDCFALITSKSGKIFAKTLDERLTLNGITRTQWIAMYYIYNSECITQKALADKMAIREPTVVRLIQKMELDGFLQRTDCYKDKRKKYLKLTEKGVEIYFRLMPVVEKFKEDTVSGIDEQDLATLKNVLNKMTENALKL